MFYPVILKKLIYEAKLYLMHRLLIQMIDLFTFPMYLSVIIKKFN